VNYFILDDDISTRKIMQRIIREESLGEVIGESEHPIEAENEILLLKPDIVTRRYRDCPAYKGKKFSRKMYHDLTNRK
jgi:chemotaxis response regulator CheB